METVIALAQVFLLVFIIVGGAWILGLGLCRMADDENDDEQQIEWIREQATRRQMKRAAKERKREQRLKKRR